jgi:hypothetical protein
MLQHVLTIQQLKYGMFHLHSIGLLLQHIHNIHHKFMALEWLDNDTLASAGLLDNDN